VNDNLTKLPLTRTEAINWINALRSGDYKQGREKLVTEYADGTCRYCCLGVLSKVCGLPSTDSAFIIQDSMEDAINYYIKLDRDTQVQLAEMNDGVLDPAAPELKYVIPPWNFEQIADYIEHQILPTLSD